MTTRLTTEHRRGPPRIALALAFALGCGGGAGVNERPAPPPPASAAESNIRAAVQAEPPLDPAPAPTLRLSTELAGGARLRMQNRGREPARLRTRALIERRGAEGWERISGSIALRVRCEDEPSECLTLAPGAELVVPLRSDDGTGECACAPCPELGPDEVRFVAESCAPPGHIPHRVTSPPLPAPRR